MAQIDARIVPNLWFDREAVQAAEHYIAAFGGNGRIIGTTPAHPDAPSPQDVPVVVEFELDGQPFVGINGGPQFHFTEAVSLEVRVDGQEQIDRIWAALVEGGQEQPCGWLKDKYGLSWQITPTGYYDLLARVTSAANARLMAAVLSTVGKFDVAALEAAYRSERAVGRTSRTVGRPGTPPRGICPASVTSKTCNWKASCRPVSGLRRYIAAAVCPFAVVESNCISPGRSAGHLSRDRAPMAAGPTYQLSKGGISQIGVVGEQLLQRVDVVGLEGRNVARQQFARLRGFRCGQRLVRAGSDGVELGPRPLQQTVDRRRRRADRVGHLGGPPLQHIAQHQHRALAG